MNERIEAYLKQHHCRDYFNSYGETVEDDHYFMYREEVDGLIELIVRDISQMIESQDVDPAFKHRISWAVKDRFGVE